MKKKTLAKIIGISAISIILGSCGLSDENTPEACKFEVSQALDKGNYDVVIQKLSSDPTCGGAYTPEEGKIQLAAAYIGKAGFDIPSLISDIIDAGADKNTDNYTLFVQAIAKRAKGETLNYLEKAKKLYKEIYGQINCDDKNQLQNAPDIIKDACFYAGLTDTAKATTSVTLLIGGDTTDTNEIVNLVEKWANSDGGTSTFTCDTNDINANGIPDSADVSACALKYSTDLSAGKNPTVPYNCGGNIFISAEESNVQFTKPSTTFTSLTIIVNKDQNCSDPNLPSSKTYKRLIYDIGSGIYTTAITEGYCDTNRNICSDITVSSCYPCPVVTETEQNGQIVEEPVSTVDTVIETINEGADSILAVIPEDVTGDTSTIKEKVTEFKKDLCSYEPSACLCDTNGDGVGDTDCDKVGNIDTVPDVDIKSPKTNPDVQQLIADYLQKNK